MKQVTKGAKIRLHFSLSVETERQKTSIVDSIFDKEPAEFTMGDGSLPEGFETFLLEMNEGEDKTFTLLPEQAFGLPNPANIHVMPREKFKNFQLEVGLVVSFSDPRDHERPGVVTQINDQMVTVDFNHPLAGKTIYFRACIVEILSVPPS